MKRLPDVRRGAWIFAAGAELPGRRPAPEAAVSHHRLGRQTEQAVLGPFQNHEPGVTLRRRDRDTDDEFEAPAFGAVSTPDNPETAIFNDLPVLQNDLVYHVALVVS